MKCGVFAYGEEADAAMGVGEAEEEEEEEDDDDDDDEEEEEEEESAEEDEGGGRIDVGDSGEGCGGRAVRGEEG